MEEIRKLEEPLKTTCIGGNQYEIWSMEPSSDSPYHSKADKAYYDLLPSKKAMILKKALWARCLHRSKSWKHQSDIDSNILCWKSTSRIRNRPAVVVNELVLAIGNSRKILQLGNNWDGEGSAGYSEVTWNRATNFLLSSAARYWRDHRRWVASPRITPGPDGSIDIHWKTPKRELLINIPANPEEPAAYYGDDKEDGTENAVRGKKLDTSTYNEWIIAWLMK